MSKGFDEKQFNKWIELRGHFRRMKREKDYPGIVAIGSEIIRLSARSPAIGIVAALFERDIAEAHNKMGDTAAAVSYYKRAIDSFVEYRATKKLRSPDDFLADIEKLKKKLQKLELKR